MQACPTLSGVTAHTFATEVVPANVPVVLRGLCAGWPVVAQARHSDLAVADYLKALAAPGDVEFMTAAPQVRGEFFFGDSLETRNFHKGRAPLRDVLDRLLALADDPSPPAVYVQSTPAELCLPQFARQNTMPLLPPEVTPRVWLGNAVRVQTHYDLSDNIAVVAAGCRRFTLFPPDQLPNLYMGRFETTLAGSPVSLADIEKPDFERFPRLPSALAAGRTAELEPGDAIYIPYGWWHHVRSLSAFNLLVNYWWNDSPAHLQAPYGALMLSMLMLRDMPPPQRDVWKTMFDHFVFGVNGDPGAHLEPGDRGALAALSHGQHAVAMQRVLRGLIAYTQGLGKS